MKQLPLDRYFDINNVKGLRSLIKGVLELAKEPSRLCLEEASYGAYAGYGGNYANSQLPTSVPQSTAYGAYPPA
ncbi:hypothetical protein RJT34_07888 [Clitoria ternatea]|uniref:Uncharacterized protein n=1 Tax=Clitoria ternatea TaxID=43366 RepID=A0AAN9PSG5_CLITE